MYMLISFELYAWIHAYIIIYMKWRLIKWGDAIKRVTDVAASHELEGRNNNKFKAPAADNNMFRAAMDMYYDWNNSRTNHRSCMIISVHALVTKTMK